MSNEQDGVYPLKAGIYTPFNGDPVIFIDPAEILQDRGLPDTNETRLAIYQAFKNQYEAEDMAVLLVEREPGESMADYLNRNQDSAETGDEAETEQPAEETTPQPETEQEQPNNE